MSNRQDKKIRKELRKASKEYAMKAQSEIVQKQYMAGMYKLIRQRTLFQLLFFASLVANTILVLKILGVL